MACFASRRGLTYPDGDFVINSLSRKLFRFLGKALGIEESCGVE